ncbi:MAG: hypothetical protein GXY78_05865 [Deltaproteobacteria bacterium]|jgi:hypothetical protein|nr:hypothetical protein [Deltaproteobacteria bacterium]
MAKATISRLKVKELYDKGLNLADIARETGSTKGAICKVLKQMNIAVTKAALPAAGAYVEKKETATDHLLFLVGKMKDELSWLEEEVPRATDPEYRAWQAQKIAFSGEMRKLITAIGDIGYRLFQANEVAEVLRIIDEEIGHESAECQARIRERIKRRRDLRFPGGVD